jgi:hypothetical protein
MGGELFLVLADSGGAAGGLELIHDAHLDEPRVCVDADTVGAKDLDLRGLGVVRRRGGGRLEWKDRLGRYCGAHR